MRHRNEIDGLRAIAVAAVILTHAGAPLRGGFLGVDIFFVISGYLITLILVREINEQRFTFAGFYARRARRILPALVLVSVCTVPVAWMVMPPTELQQYGQSLVALAFFATNLLFWHQSGYFAPATEEMPLIHTWSLAVEEQFYLLFPVVLVMLWRLGPRAVFIWLGLAALASLALAEVAARAIPNAAFYLLPFRAWELLAGALAALAVARHGLPGSRTVGLWHAMGRHANVLALSGLGMIVLSLAWHHPWLPIPGLWLVPPIAGTVMVLLFATRGTLAHWLLSRPPMIGLGLISYSAYLWHQPLFAFARIGQFDPPQAWQMVGLTALTLVLAWASWRWVEGPFRNPAQMSARQTAAAITAGGALAAGIGLAVHLGEGLPGLRFSPTQTAILASATPSPLRAECHVAPATPFEPERACVFPVGSKPGWAVLGDSHGVEIAHTLGDALVPRGESLVQLTVSGCPPALGFDPGLPGCAEWISNAIAWLEDNPGIHTILLAWRHSAYLYGPNSESFPALPNDPYRIANPGTPEEKRALYWAAVSTLIERLATGERRVVFVEPIPEIARSIGKYALHRPTADVLLPTVSRRYYATRNKDILSWFKRMQVETLPVADQLCDETQCYGAIAGTALYFDDDHLSMAGARRVIAPLFTETQVAGSKAMP